MPLWQLIPDMFSLNNFTLKHFILLSIWADYLWEQYLRARQYQKTLSVKDPPNELKTTMPKKNFDKARSYMLERKRFAFVKDFFAVTTSTVVILYEILPVVWQHTSTMYQVDEVFQNCLWYLTFTSLLAFVNFPLTLYEIFVVERNNAKKKCEILAWEKLKTFIWSQVFLMAISSVLVVVIQKGDHVFAGVWGIFCAAIFIVGMTYPMVAPTRFRQLIPLPDGELKTEIIHLAQQLDFPLKDIYIEERFKKTSSHSTYFYGTPNQKSIVLSDSLVMKEDGVGYLNEEILAILSLEFGRWYHNHSIKYLLALEINLLLSFAGFFIMFKNPEVYRAFGFYDAEPVLVGVYVVLKYVMVLYSTSLGFFFMCVSRKFTNQEDDFVVSLGKSNALVSALLRQERNNLAFPVYDRLYSMWHHDKPPLLERIRVIKEAGDIKLD